MSQGYLVMTVLQNLPQAPVLAPWPLSVCCFQPDLTWDVEASLKPALVINSEYLMNTNGSWSV